MSIEEFAKDFDTIEPRKDWHALKVWEVSNKRDDGACVGLPIYVLSDGKKYRYADPDEVFKIRRDEYPDIEKDE